MHWLQVYRSDALRLDASASVTKVQKYKNFFKRAIPIVN